jgi:hypothetical protein
MLGVLHSQYTSCTIVFLLCSAKMAPKTYLKKGGDCISFPRKDRCDSYDQA